VEHIFAQDGAMGHQDDFPGGSGREAAFLRQHRDLLQADAILRAQRESGASDGALRDEGAVLLVRELRALQSAEKLVARARDALGPASK
jgi:hypothetical protein